MKLVRVIGIGIIIWIFGVSLYSLSFFIKVLDNPDLQANIVLASGILPLVWVGAKLYYRGKSTTEGYWIGLSFFAIAAFLDALITVPILVAPYGGNHYSFFTAAGFWLIGIEIVITATIYWYTRVLNKRSEAR